MYFRVALLAFLAWVCGTEMFVFEDTSQKAEQKKVTEGHDINLNEADAVAAGANGSLKELSSSPANCFSQF